MDVWWHKRAHAAREALRAAHAWPAAAYVLPALGIGVVTFTTGAALTFLRDIDLSAVYLPVVLATAIAFGRGPAIVASMASFLAYNWFFIDPVHTLTVANPEEWVVLTLFLVVAIVVSQVADSQRRRTAEAVRREREARALHVVGRLLSAHDDLDTALAALVKHLLTELDLASCAVLVSTPSATSSATPSTLSHGRADRRPAYRALAGEPPPADEQIASHWLAGSAPREARARGAPLGRWIRVRPPVKRGAIAVAKGPARSVSYVPLRAGERTTGMLRLATAPERAPWTPEDERLVTAAADLIALALERERLARAAVAAEVLRQTEDTRQAVLASVSHDLRTPLASIKAAAGSLRQRDVDWTWDERETFASSIEQQADYLHELVSHLLDMSRIEAGTIRPSRDWYPIDALVDDVLGRLRERTAAHTVVTEIEDDLPPVPLDYVQAGVVLTNLVENAAKYAPPGTRISVTAKLEGDSVRVSVRDQGPGVAPEQEARVFEKFYRVVGGDGAAVKGLGLGLAIARGMVQAHGGRIGVSSPPPGEERGAEFWFTLPLTVPGFASPPVLGAAA